MAHRRADDREYPAVHPAEGAVATVGSRSLCNRLAGKRFPEGILMTGTVPAMSFLKNSFGTLPGQESLLRNGIPQKWDSALQPATSQPSGDGLRTDRANLQR